MWSRVPGSVISWRTEHHAIQDPHPNPPATAAIEHLASAEGDLDPNVNTKLSPDKLAIGLNGLTGK